jgi:hypothetical protein
MPTVPLSILFFKAELGTVKTRLIVMSMRAMF